ncbi:purine permease YbbY [Paenibacillus sp. J31TS4]|uniref:uracil/xanthine transporter n=1 Tax=Paenibacillus sp. J31TS4 TaxID=2807195 RepID=UPI001B03E236|nr:uracil/xanthine transporter [Paenibacillus sp. J31TS4]GIP40211.1 purine permease YbbY [Paenibacillus sp. J31TS4]
MSKWVSTTTWLAGIQWLFFLFANTVVVPVSMGTAFHLPPEEVAAALQRSFVLVGAACMLQAAAGHRYALMEGPSGIWWGVILSLCASAPSMGISLAEVGGGLAAGILLAGLTTIILGVCGFGGLLKRVFTPVVMSVYLFLLSIELVLIFFQGMTGLSTEGRLDLPVTLLSLFIVGLVICIQVRGRGRLSNFSILIGMVAGWMLYRLFFPAAPHVQSARAPLLSLFPWGAPHLEWGILLTAFLAGLLNMTNTITALGSAEKLYGTVTTDGQYRRSFVWTGLAGIVSGLLGLVPSGPYTSSIGFLQSTRILERSALIAGGGLFVLMGLVPALGAFFSTLPVSVGNAVLFVAYLQLFGTALRTVQGVGFHSRTIYRVAVPLLTGICILFLPPEGVASLPAFIRPLAGNGLLMGMLLAVIVEHGVKWSRYEQPDLTTGGNR